MPSVLSANGPDPGCPGSGRWQQAARLEDAQRQGEEGLRSAVDHTIAASVPPGLRARRIADSASWCAGMSITPKREIAASKELGARSRRWASATSVSTGPALLPQHVGGDGEHAGGDVRRQDGASGLDATGGGRPALRCRPPRRGRSPALMPARSSIRSVAAAKTSVLRAHLVPRLGHLPRLPLHQQARFIAFGPFARHRLLSLSPAIHDRHLPSTVRPQYGGAVKPARTGEERGSLCLGV